MKRWTLLLTMLVVGLTACNDTTTPDDAPLAGTYSATYFRVTPSGEGEIDVLLNGGELNIVIAENNTTSGRLILPANVNGGLTASMAGTAALSGSTVTFQQVLDTPVRDLSWERTSGGLSVTDQSIEGTLYTITLTRQ